MHKHTMPVTEPHAFAELARARLDAHPPALSRPGLRPAAVLVPLLPVKDTLHLLFTVRTATMPTHPGEVCFPGGRLRPGEDARAAALREAGEEVGIAPHQVQVLGFGDVRQTASGHLVAPLLGLVARECVIRPCPREVAQVFTAPLAHFLDAASYDRQQALVDGRRRSWWVVHWQRWRIWGATAAILWRLRERLAP